MLEDNNYLMLSGIQHYYFCKRQWCLIHIEQAWEDNLATKEGDYLHKKADNPFVKEKRKDLIISRAMPVSSSRLKFSGILDVVEFEKSEEGIKLSGYDGLYKPYIVEYKRGKEKKDLRDIVQLVAQVICLEETLQCNLDYSYLFYNQTKKRKKIEITSELRELVISIADDMQRLFAERITVAATSYKNCRLCSLKEICMPRLTKKKKSIANYINSYIYGDDNEEVT